MLQGDDLNSKGIMDFLCLHLNGQIFSTYDLVMLLNINYWEVNFHHE